MVEVVDSRVDSFSVSIKGGEEMWLITGVYGPCESNLSHDFFTELERIRDSR